MCACAQSDECRRQGNDAKQKQKKGAAAATALAAVGAADTERKEEGKQKNDISTRCTI